MRNQPIHNNGTYVDSLLVFGAVLFSDLFTFIINTAPWFDDVGKAKLERFSKEVIERTALPPCNERYPLDNGVVSTGAERLYNAVYLYGLWLNHSKTHGINVRDGSALLKFSKNLSFDGIAVPCDIGTNGDQVPYFWVNQFVGPDVHVQAVAISSNKNVNLKLLTKFEWKTEDGRPPLDTPLCGFLNEFCPSLPGKDSTVAVVLSCLVVLLILTATVTIAYTIRKRKLETTLLESIWKVAFEDIDLQKSKLAFGSRANARSQSALSHFSSESTVANHARLYSTNAAMYKGQMVAVRKIRDQVLLTKMDLHHLKTMREMMHDNINPFLGACFVQPSPCVLFLYCPKGSLQDILENDEMKLDINLKYSLTMDLVQGMHFIHSSKLEFHGRLKMSSLYKAFTECLLWTAPELLSNGTLTGSKAGDVYSFGIVMHEIAFRMGTFAGVSHLKAKDIVNRVKAMEADPCRPLIFTDDESVLPAVCTLMKSCWNDDPKLRPTFSVIRSYIKKNIQIGESLNIVDVILQRLEKYASNLEDLVDQRTQQLMQEKDKSDRLLYRMLPKTCAEKLKRGEMVQPDIFEAATIFFSDIVGFTTIAARSTPMQVVDLLNDLYTCFDDIIGKYDAYKVETIGDAYLVVSGIPTRNGDLHAAIIADMSLDILAGVKVFTIKHMPHEDVQVRIGCNTGPCCAGVVGLSMPRYCLFGDTVNTASRMESNGAAQQIHLSEATHVALHKIGGYTTRFRANMPIKGKGAMNTFWLEGKEGRSMAKTD
ncbi:hypothetical protein DPMN_100194 [Dreissena polymorpha]|uniref:Guanylate cyclase n=1 Tax=Dreissena polymorpha TaxID=45954 RepID=A0A9D4LGV6_DREPO|nr:hypothetical protein DPMN_100194 [Dreissena polymorpha]